MLVLIDWSRQDVRQTQSEAVFKGPPHVILRWTHSKSLLNTRTSLDCFSLDMPYIQSTDRMG